MQQLKDCVEREEFDQTDLRGVQFRIVEKPILAQLKTENLAELPLFYFAAVAFQRELGDATWFQIDFWTCEKIEKKLLQKE